MTDELKSLIEEYDAVLRGLASYVGAGGFNNPSPLIDPQVADEKIRWGIDHILKIEQAKQEPVAWCAGYDDPRMGRIHSDPSMCEPEVDALVSRCEGRIVKVPLFAAPVVQPDDIKDAERYRMLRNGGYWPAAFYDHDEPEPLRGEELDTAIDAAMAAEKETSPK